MEIDCKNEHELYLLPKQGLRSITDNISCINLPDPFFIKTIIVNLRIVERLNQLC